MKEIFHSNKSYYYEEDNIKYINARPPRILRLENYYYCYYYIKKIDNKGINFEEYFNLLILISSSSSSSSFHSFNSSM